MGLRTRVVVTLVAIILPLTAAFALVSVSVERRTEMRRAAERFANRPGRKTVRRCERDPKSFVFDRPRLRAFAYDENFQSANRDAPDFPVHLRDLEEGPQSDTFWFEDYLGVTAVELYDDRTEACVYMLLLWKEGRGLPTKMGPIALRAIVVFLILLMVGMVIAEPIVRRILKLADAVGAAAIDGFDADKFPGKDELNVLASAFENAFNELELRDTSLKNYVANTTHDLAIPLTVLQHRLRRLQSRPLDDESQKLVGTALEESVYIGSLIANMSAAARLDSEPKFAEFDLAEIVARVVKRHEPIAVQNGISLDYAVPENLMKSIDATLVEQAMSNLVQNAIQYNVEGGHVAVVLSNDRFTVQDDGPGVAEQMIDRLTQRSIRGDARTRNPDGQGFGLSIVARVCELHDWRLNFENNDPGFLAEISW